MTSRIGTSPGTSRPSLEQVQPRGVTAADLPEASAAVQPQDAPEPVAQAAEPWDQLEGRQRSAAMLDPTNPNHPRSSREGIATVPQGAILQRPVVASRVTAPSTELQALMLEVEQLSQSLGGTTALAMLPAATDKIVGKIENFQDQAMRSGLIMALVAQLESMVQKTVEHTPARSAVIQQVGAAISGKLGRVIESSPELNNHPKKATLLGYVKYAGLINSDLTD